MTSLWDRSVEGLGALRGAALSYGSDTDGWINDGQVGVDLLREHGHIDEARFVETLLEQIKAEMERSPRPSSTSSTCSTRCWGATAGPRTSPTR